MKTVIKLLHKELKAWKQQYAAEKKYWKGNEHDCLAQHDLEDCKLHIAELERAILKLKNGIER